VMRVELTLYGANLDGPKIYQTMDTGSYAYTIATERLPTELGRELMIHKPPVYQNGTSRMYAIMNKKMTKQFTFTGAAGSTVNRSNLWVVIPTIGTQWTIRTFYTDV